MFKLHSQLTTDDWAAYRQAEHVRKLARHVPDAAPLVAALDVALGHVDSGGATVMNPGEIAAATAAVYDADAALVAAIFNGWPPDREWPAPAQMVEDLIHDQTTPTPVITIGASIERPLSAGRSFALESGSDQVEISIREGTSKFDVIAALWRAVKLVESRWELLIADTEKVEETEEAQPVPVPAGGPEAMSEAWEIQIAGETSTVTREVHPEDPADARTKGYDVYQPHLANWSVPIRDVPKDSDGNVWRIESDIPNVTDRLIATVLIGPHFTREEGKSIVRMMYSAPFLWRRLREAGSCLNECDPPIATLLGRVVQELAEAAPANTQVYEPRDWDRDEDSRFVARMRAESERVAKLVAAEKGGAA